MARMRMVKPDMRKSLTVSAWPIPVRWTFVGLLGYLDDFGRGHDENRLLKAELYPLDDQISGRAIAKHLDLIAETGPLCRYEVAGKRYLHIISWSEHQKVSHPSPSRIPPCPSHEAANTGRNGAPNRNGSGTAPESFGNDSGEYPEPSGNVPSRAGAGAGGSGKGKDHLLEPKEAAPEAPTPIRPRDDLFDAMVEACGIDASALTSSGRAPINAALKQLRAVNATPGQITLRARNFRERYRDATLTPSALAKHWAALGGAAPPRAAFDPLASARSGR